MQVERRDAQALAIQNIVVGTLQVAGMVAVLVSDSVNQQRTPTRRTSPITAQRKVNAREWR
jgi:hypothetical protein